MPGKRGGGRRKKRGASVGASRGRLSGKPRTGTPRGKPMSANRRKGFAGGKRPYDYAAYEKEEATPEYMARLFAQHNFTPDERALERYWQYYCLLREHNARLDLTRIMGIEATVLKHFVDSAIVADLVEIEGPLLDIGSGPGFPGGVLAIHKPELPLILGESRGKRVEFLDLLLRDLKLANAVVYSRSVREDSPFVSSEARTVAADAEAPSWWAGGGDEPVLPPDVQALPVRSVVSRALEVIPATLARVRPYIPAGGAVLFMKGPNCGREVTEAQQGFKGIYRMRDDISYTLPNTGQRRRLVVFEKREEETA